MSSRSSLVAGIANSHAKASSPGRLAGDILQQASDLLNDAFAALSSRYAAAPPKLVESISYSLTAGGKRLRPALVLETARACQHRGGATIDLPPGAIASAVAMELVHTFSLVHDDLPAMDDDDFRRGRPTNHIVFGEAMAILAGDAMLALAFEIIATDAAPATVSALVKELAAATGPAGMVGGQVLDIAAEGTSIPLAELKQLHAMKTGALLIASARMGAIAANATDADLAAVTSFTKHLGLAFQIVDDVLDITATAEQLGKATGKDAAKGKNTYPGLLGLDGAQQQAKAELAAALGAIASFGPEADGLRAMARFVVERDT